MNIHHLYGDNESHSVSVEALLRRERERARAERLERIRERYGIDPAGLLAPGAPATLLAKTVDRLEGRRSS